MKHVIIGTAGHVDHGKTVLVRSLTGVDTDRLKEEKERGISIELGFAYLKLPSGQTAGIVDVPGHERFVKNMLAGVGGIDIVLLVVAADEGIMTQTREHLDIIQLLQIEKGIVVITKKDLVDEDWHNMVQGDLVEFLKGTMLENAPVITVSATTGQGLNELVKAIDNLAAGERLRSWEGPARLSVDRVFSVTGFGTVATGTLLSGMVKVGDNLQIYPGDLIARVRNLHVHGHRVDQAEAGQRLAVNLSGIETDDILRGNVLGAPGSLEPSHRLDARLNYLASAPKPLKHRARVRVYLGTEEVLGRVVLLDREEMLPGESAFVQLQLELPVVSVRGDRFVIRSYSPMRTTGGGTIIDPSPKKHKRNRHDVIEALATLEMGSPAELVEQFLNKTPKLITTNAMLKALAIGDAEMNLALQELLAAGAVVKFNSDEGELYLSSRVLERWADNTLTALKKYHQKFPLREGYPKEELRSRLYSSTNTKHFQMLLNHFENIGQIKVHARCVNLADFLPDPTGEELKTIKTLENAFLKDEFQPPNWSEAVNLAKIKSTDDSQEFLSYLLARGTLVKIAEGIYFHQDAVHKAVSLIGEHLAQKNEISLGEVRDLLKTSRKFALPLLEYLDREKITRRVGDMRMAGKSLPERPKE